MFDSNGKSVAERSNALIPLDHRFWCDGEVGRDRAWFKGRIERNLLWPSGTTYRMYALSLPTLEISAQYTPAGTDIRGLKWDPITESVYCIESDEVSCSVVCLDAHSLKHKWDRRLPPMNTTPWSLTVLGEHVYIAYRGVRPDSMDVPSNTKGDICIYRCSTMAQPHLSLLQVEQIAIVPIPRFPDSQSDREQDSAILDIAGVPNSDDHLAVFHGCPAVYCTIIDLTTFTVFRVTPLGITNFSRHFTVFQSENGQKLNASTMVRPSDHEVQWTKLVMT
jgi:hypothetical protein